MEKMTRRKVAARKVLGSVKDSAEKEVSPGTPGEALPGEELHGDIEETVEGPASQAEAEAEAEVY